MPVEKKIDMISIMNPALASHDQCFGCMACGDVCPQDCISFVPDKEGFLHPQIDGKNCIGCHRCMKVCPVVTPIDWNQQEQTRCFAAWGSVEVRKKSASGGAFYAIAEHAIKQGGYVSGAIFSRREVKHIVTNDLNELKKIQGTKYFQSNTRGIYKRINELLKNGNKIIFSGTSCQVAGLLNVVGKNDNLITVDLICFGVPSPKSIEVEELMRGKKLTEIISSRDKKHKGGWRNSYFMTCRWDDGTETISSQYESFMLGSFCSGKIMRNNCYHCPFKHIERMSDITIGDYHNVNGFDDQREFGISLIMCHSDKGLNYVKRLNNIELYQRPVVECLPGKRTIYYNDELYSTHPMRKHMLFMFKHTPSWLLKACYQSVLKTKNPLLWPLTALDVLYLKINEQRAKKVLIEIKKNNTDENRSNNIS